jgi:hypothetical protein
MADYNLGDKKNCLIGNWLEEHALEDYTGHFRVPPKEDQGYDYGLVFFYDTQWQAYNCFLTICRSHTRCIEHTVRLEPKNQVTSNRRDFNHPA